MSYGDNIPEATKGDYSIVKHGVNISLMDGSISWMDNSIWETGTHDEYKSKLKGDVLIAGLGLGYDVWLAENEPLVTSAVVVEYEQDIIDLVWPYMDIIKTTLVHDKVLNYMQTTDKKFDFIWFDIFECSYWMKPIDTQTLANAATPLLNYGGEILFWSYGREPVL